VEQLPAIFDVKFEKAVTKLVKSLIETRRENPDSDVSDIENELDRLICELFGLTKSETNIILTGA
jgi:hypothetical protein